MSGDVLDPRQDDKGDVHLAGGQKVSMQLVQQMYKEVTGKSERMTRNISCAHQTEFPDLENLNSKIEQLLEQYNVAEKSCSVTFFHTNDSTERYSSFDRARACEMGSTSPVEGIRIEYDFLIVLPVAKQPQPYKISINIHSRAAILDKLRSRQNFQAKFLWLMGSEETGSISIEYVDYAVARNMMSAIVQWFDGLHQVQPSKLVSLLKKFSSNFDWVFKYVTASVLATIFASIFLENKINPTPSHVLYAGTVAFSCVFVLSGLSLQLGMFLEGAIDSYQPLSYLKINRGDEKVIKSFGTSRTKAIWAAIGSIILALLLNVAGGLIAAKIPFFL